MIMSKGGFRKDLNYYFRSRWEANIARYYNFVGIEWQYEPKEFEFHRIKKGSRFYKPDFYLPDSDSWVEVKGWFQPGDKTKLKRFKKYYPEEFAKLWFVISDPFARSKANAETMGFLLDGLKIDFSRIINYNNIERALGKLIPSWE